MLIVAGDPSGDLYGSLLIRALKKESASLRILAVGGALMRESLENENDFMFDLASLGVTGFFAPLKRLPLFLGLGSRLKKLFSEPGRPDILVCIDFYGFNRRVLSLARRAGVPAYYFISPQVWASRPGRIRALKKLIERMLVIFPFEESIYREAGIPVEWVGHPLLDIVPEPSASQPPPLRLGLMPGSRASEVRRHLPILLEATTRITKDYPDTEVTIFAAPQLPDGVYTTLAASRPAPGRPPRLVRESNYLERARQHLVLTSSGTATLENALLGLPMVVIYKLAWPTYALAKLLIRVPHIAMANILAGKKLVPELIQSDANPGQVAKAALDILGNPSRLKILSSELAALRSKLGQKGAMSRTAHILLTS